MIRSFGTGVPTAHWHEAGSSARGTIAEYAGQMVDPVTDPWSPPAPGQAGAISGRPGAMNPRPSSVLITSRLAHDAGSGRQGDLRRAVQWVDEGIGAGFEDLVVGNDRPIRWNCGQRDPDVARLVGLMDTGLISALRRQGRGC